MRHTLATRNLSELTFLFLLPSAPIRVTGHGHCSLSATAAPHPAAHIVVRALSAVTCSAYSNAGLLERELTHWIYDLQVIGGSWTKRDGYGDIKTS